MPLFRNICLVLLPVIFFSCKKNESPESTMSPVDEGIIVSGELANFSELTFELKSDIQYFSSSWDFGDGSKSSLTKPVKKYDYVGTYLVRLTVNAHSTQRVFEKTITIGLKKNNLITNRKRLCSAHYEFDYLLPSNKQVLDTVVLVNVSVLNDITIQMTGTPGGYYSDGKYLQPFLDGPTMKLIIETDTMLSYVNSSSSAVMVFDKRNRKIVYEESSRDFLGHGRTSNYCKVTYTEL